MWCMWLLRFTAKCQRLSIKEEGTTKDILMIDFVDIYAYIYIRFFVA